MYIKKPKVNAPILSAAFLAAIFAFQPVSASAATHAVAVGDVNLRAGPSKGYPVVAMLRAGSSITTYGCMNGSWCDVDWGGNRGWVSASYIQVVYAGRPVMLSPDVMPSIGLPVVSFDQRYWNTHYSGRSWYGNYDAYRNGPDDIERARERYELAQQLRRERDNYNSYNSDLGSEHYQRAERLRVQGSDYRSYNVEETQERFDRAEQARREREGYDSYSGDRARDRTDRSEGRSDRSERGSVRN